MTFFFWFEMLFSFWCKNFYVKLFYWFIYWFYCLCSCPSQNRQISFMNLCSRAKCHQYGIDFFFFLILIYATKVINLHCYKVLKQKCTFSFQSWINIYWFGAYSVCTYLFFPSLCVEGCSVHTHALKRYNFFSPERVTFNLNGFVSHLA